MNVAFNPQDLEAYLLAASQVSTEYPVVISQFHQNSKEIEIDAVAKNGKVLCQAIIEHVENAGVHSGDSSMVLPAQKLYTQTIEQIKKIAQKIARELNITGPFNIQFLAENNRVMVIECNLRASRSLPFVSKVTGINFAKLATEAILGIDQRPETRDQRPDYVAVKAPQFSFARIKGADPILRVEMASTGVSLPKKSVFISLAGEENKSKFQEAAKTLFKMGLKIYATAGTAQFFKNHGIDVTKLYKIHEHQKPVQCPGLSF